MKGRATLIFIIMAVIGLLVGCTNEQALPGKNTCYVSDIDGRLWMVHSGELPCLKALKKCQRWHQKAKISHFHCKAEPQAFTN